MCTNVSGFLIPVYHYDGLADQELRSLSDPTIVHSPSLHHVNLGGCVHVSNQVFNCHGNIVKTLKVVKTSYGWRIPHVSNAAGSQATVYVPFQSRSFV